VAESRSVSQNGVRLYTAGCRLVLLRIHAVFKWIAERAALKLGHAGGPAAVFFWLDLLKRDAPTSGVESTAAWTEPKRTMSVAAWIELCEAWADYCLKLENENVTAARRYNTALHLQSSLEKATEQQNDKPANEREAFVMPILDEKGLVDS